MAKDNKIQMPQSGAGLTSYFDGQESKIMFSPESAIIAIVIAVVLIMAVSGYIF